MGRSRTLVAARRACRLVRNPRPLGSTPEGLARMPVLARTPDVFSASTPGVAARPFPVYARTDAGGSPYRRIRRGARPGGSW